MVFVERDLAAPVQMKNAQTLHGDSASLPGHELWVHREAGPRGRAGRGRELNNQKQPKCSLIENALNTFLVFFKKRFYLFSERGEGKEKERERNINVWLPLTHPPLWTRPATQARVLTGNRTSNTLIHSPRSTQ